jgi:glutamate formiminotransferase
MYGTVMTESDKELARRIAKRFRVPVYWTEHDITELAAAFAALREECAKVADGFARIDVTNMSKRIAKAIRTAQPAKAQEGA